MFLERTFESFVRYNKKIDLGLCGHPGSLVPVRCTSAQNEDAQQLNNYMTNAFVSYDNSTRGVVLLFRQVYHLSQYLTNLMHKICFTISFISCLYMFRAHVLIIRRSKLYYTAFGIITPIGGRPQINLLILLESQQ